MGVYALFLPFAIRAYEGRESYSSLAIMAFVAFEFIVPKHHYRLTKMDKRGLLLNSRRLGSSGFLFLCTSVLDNGVRCGLLQYVPEGLQFAVGKCTALHGKCGKMHFSVGKPFLCRSFRGVKARIMRGICWKPTLRAQSLKNSRSRSGIGFFFQARLKVSSEPPTKAFLCGDF